jgi:hypothetical protein
VHEDRAYRHNVKCADINAYYRIVIPWVTVCRYFSNVKKSLFKSFNGVFGKIGHRASADVIVHLFKTKCLPIFLYAMEARPVNTTETKSLDFALFRIYAKFLKHSQGK